MGPVGTKDQQKKLAFRYAEGYVPSSGISGFAPASGDSTEGRSMQRAETIKGLQRGLQVLEALQASPTSSLHAIHLATRISKPSLLRILNTLERAGYVSRRLADGHYRISAFTGIARKRDRHDRVVEAAGPVLDRLCRKVRWPSDMMVPAGDHMERRETSQAYSPFFMHPFRDRVAQAQAAPFR